MRKGVRARRLFALVASLAALFLVGVAGTLLYLRLEPQPSGQRQFMAVAQQPQPKLTTSALSLPLSSVSSAQNLPFPIVSQSWANKYGGGSGEGAADVWPTSDGGYLAVGWTKSFGAQGWNDEWFVKLDGFGNIQSQRRIGGSDRDDIQRLELTSDGGYITVALSDSFGASQHAPLVLKFDSAGNLQWQKNYMFSGRDWGNSIKKTSDGGYIIVGGTDPSNSGPVEPAAIKVDPQGNIVWQMFYGSPDGALAWDVLQTADGGYLIVANTTAFGQGGADGWLIKTDTTGNIQWQKTYGGTGDDGFSSLAQTSDGGYIIAGGTSSFGSGGEDLWVLKLNADGSVVWQKAYGGSGNEDGRFIRQTTDGGYIVGGSTTTYAATGSDLWVLKLDSNGAVVWQRSYDSGAPSDTANAVRQTPDGGFVVAGFSGAGCPLCNPAPAPQYFTVLKLQSDGTVAAGCPTSVGSLTSGNVVDTSVVLQNSSAAAQAATFTVTNTSVNIANTNGAATSLCGLAIPVPMPQNEPQVPSQIKSPGDGGRSGARSPLVVDEVLSRTTTKYLHHNGLPFVNAQVLEDAMGEPSRLVLSGQARTDFGKQDAEQKARNFLRNAQVQIENQIAVDTNVASRSIEQRGQPQELTLPAAFLGCWRGTSTPQNLDSYQYLGGCPPRRPVSETQELCFRRAADGSFTITSQSANAAIPNFRQQTELVSSEGGRSIKLKEAGSYGSLGFPSESITFTGVSRCDLVSNGETLACRGSGLYRCNGAPWYREVAHGEMYRVSR